MKITEVNSKTIVIKGDTDEEYIDILDATKEAICKVAPDCGVTIKVSFGLKDEDSDEIQAIVNKACQWVKLNINNVSDAHIESLRNALKDV